MPALPTDLPSLSLEDKDKQTKILDLLRPLVLTESQQERIREVFLDEMRLGLAAKPERKSSLLMENTFVPELPDGRENGEYLALDLGSTNFRVMYINLKNGAFVEEAVEYFQVPDTKRLGPGEELFDFLAGCIEEFLEKRNMSGRKFELGFTFSFPMTQKSLKVGLLAAWTKSFNCPGVEGEDVVLMLNEAIKRKRTLDVTVTAILNDTTGTLVQGAYVDKRCALAMILGTGNNGCYIEKVSRIEKWLGKHTEEEMIVDIEWGGFGDNGVLDFMRTDWDRAVDNLSLIPGSYTFEKYVGGKFLGDIVREVLLTLAKDGLFGSTTLGKLEVEGSITTSNLSDIERDSFEGTTDSTRKVLESQGFIQNDSNIKVMQFVAGIVCYRAAHLVSILSGILLMRMERPHCTVAIDGSLFKHHPRFKPLMERLIAQYAPGRPFDLQLVHDGSGKGAALVASIARKLKKRDQRD